MAILIKKTPDLDEKLQILSRDSSYDLACACATGKNEHRIRSKDEKWIYPVALANGGRTFLFKTLLSNECVNNCKYCPLRSRTAHQLCRLSPEELLRKFTAYYNAGRVSGLFLSSAVGSTPDATMQRINEAALMLRKKNFRGYIHLKIIPGASEAAIRKSISLASAVSLNIETAGEDNFKLLSTTKDYMRDIIQPIRLISRLTAKGSLHENVKHTTQFVVGASNETDKEIIRSCRYLYKDLRLDRIYFSAYQRGLGSQELPGENSSLTNGQMLLREHRLYQADWLMRKYGFSADEIPVDRGGNLSLDLDPKEAWALLHPEFFPVNINLDPKFRLIRVPGFGEVTVEKILELRSQGSKIASLADLGKVTKIVNKAKAYITF